MHPVVLCEICIPLFYVKTEEILPGYSLVLLSTNRCDIFADVRRRKRLTEGLLTRNNVQGLH